MSRLVLFFLIAATPSATSMSQTRPLNLTPNRITLTTGRSAGSFNLNLPEGFGISIAAEGLKRVRFMAQSPDGRIFVTDMYNLTDNKRGVVYILDQLDQGSRRFNKVTQYLTGLRNPNSIAFYTDSRGVHWLYLALTDRLVRYKFTKGETAPTATPEVLATFPDFGLGYKYGGWHLTRTIAIGSNNKIYVAVGAVVTPVKKRKMCARVLSRWIRMARTKGTSHVDCAML